VFTSETSKTIFTIRNVYSKIALRFFTAATTIKIGLWDRIQQQKQKCDRKKTNTILLNVGLQNLNKLHSAQKVRPKLE
jgi:hypothetical protein